MVRLFAYNRVIALFPVAAKVQLLSTMLIGATAYPMGVYRPTGDQVRLLQAPIVRSLRAIFGMPSISGADTLLLMEAPAAASISVFSLSQRLRLLLSLLLSPPHADNPAAGLARSTVTLIPRAGQHAPGIGPRMDVANIRGFDLFRSTVSDLESLSPATPLRYEDEPPVAWRQPTQRSAIVQSISILRLTAAYDALGSSLPRWNQRTAVSQSQARPACRRHRNGPVDPRHMLMERPPSARWQDHAAWLYHAAWHAPPSAAGEIHDATPMSWIGPGGSGRLVALSGVPTHVAATVIRARLGARALQLFPFSTGADLQPPLTDAERKAVCRVCKRDQPSDRLCCVTATVPRRSTTSPLA